MLSNLTLEQDRTRKLDIPEQRPKREPKYRMSAIQLAVVEQSVTQLTKRRQFYDSGSQERHCVADETCL